MDKGTVIALVILVGVIGVVGYFFLHQIMQLFYGFGNWFSGMTDYWAGAGEYWLDQWNSGVNTVTDFGTSVWDGLIGAGDAVGNFFGDVVNTTGEIINRVWDTITFWD